VSLPEGQDSRSPWAVKLNQGILSLLSLVNLQNLLSSYCTRFHTSFFWTDYHLLYLFLQTWIVFPTEIGDLTTNSRVLWHWPDPWCEIKRFQNQQEWNEHYMRSKGRTEMPVTIMRNTWYGALSNMRRKRWYVVQILFPTMLVRGNRCPEKAMASSTPTFNTQYTPHWARGIIEHSKCDHNCEDAFWSIRLILLHMSIYFTTYSQ